MKRLLLIPLFLALLFSCGSGGSSSTSDGNSNNGNGDGGAGFNFSAHRTKGFELLVTADGKSLPGSMVLVTDAIYLTANGSRSEQESETEGRVYFRGITDSSGRVSCDLRFLQRLEEVDVVVNHKGYSGPFTEEMLRQNAGPFAPSARVRLNADLLNGLQIDLESL